MLAIGRTNPLKNFPLTLAAWERLGVPRPELCLFGVEPQVASGQGIRYVVAPPDTAVNELLNAATVFVQTSDHEGFCLPVLEAMAAGAPVVCTDAHGNRDFCVDEVNCLMADSNAGAVSEALRRLLSDDALRERLAAAGRRTADAYGWPARIAALETFLLGVAAGDGALQRDA